VARIRLDDRRYALLRCPDHTTDVGSRVHGAIIEAAK
jgi:hypothetical protein